MLECFPADLQHQAMLRIHGERLARRNSKESSVEALHIPQKTTLLVYLVGWQFRPAPMRQVGNSATAFAQQTPVFVWARRLGKAASQADDRDRSHRGHGCRSNRSR